MEPIHEAPRKMYERFIMNHAIYKFIPEEFKKSWVSVSKKGVNPRKQFWDTLRKQLVDSGEIPKTSTLANVARYIHPTKVHTCKKCNTDASIYYEYPTSNTWKWLTKEFGIAENRKSVFEIYNSISNESKGTKFAKYFGMPVEELEAACKGDRYIGKRLSPGVMSNPPDRLDGFHCYNSTCDCRSKHDKGRSDENMKTYVRDRRAYETYSDGNCLLANCLMGKLNTITSTCFMCEKSDQKMTADHIGPISLGFVHDPINFQACCSSCNSGKNNRLTQDDVNKLKALEATGATVISWWAEKVWNENKDKSASVIKQKLDKNAKKFLTIVEWLKSNKQEVVESFVTESYMNHNKSYKIRSVTIFPKGEIEFAYAEAVTDKKTKDKQYERTVQILSQANSKENRKVKASFTKDSLQHIDATNFKSEISRVLEM
jgi:Alw26I/Eco31I/Esp3I family type II restriction endonuclease